ncbi:MAG: hypothetical protein AB7I48_25255 [Planctomycetaceae bacterium]
MADSCEPLDVSAGHHERATADVPYLISTAAAGNRPIATRLASSESSLLASPVAPEDVQRGDFVAVLQEIVEFPPFLWCEATPGSSQEPVRVRCCPIDPGVPLKVQEICLPFVCATTPLGAPHTLDVRQVQLVRLTRRYAKSVTKAARRHHARLRELTR